MNARRIIIFTLPAMLCVAVLTHAQLQTSKPDAALGERIYREGLLPSGKAVRASVQDDVEVEGTQLNCAGCHRRSGFGSSEGAAFVPAVTGSALYGARSQNGADNFRRLFQEVQPARFRARVREPRPRPAYTDDALAAALREGVDPSGRTLDPLMPRYRLTNEDARHLAAYLKTLSAEPSPGVTRTELHFATVVAGDAEPEKRRAMLEVMNAYFRWKNAETIHLHQRPGRAGPYREDFLDASREWVLHVWELKGARETWPAQLDAYYRARPVFALLGGVGGDWRPVHDFCERAEVPCLFPNTDEPVVSAGNFYSIYLSKGLTVEAEALARYLSEENRPTEPKRVVQVYRDAGGGALLARALRRGLQGHAATDLRDRAVGANQKLTSNFWKSLLKKERPAALVLWLGVEDLRTLAPGDADTVSQIFVSYGLLGEGAQPPADGLRDKLYLTYPFALPSAEGPHVFRVRKWLRSKGVGPTREERLQLNTYFTLAVAEHSLVRLAGNFFRDYFVESVEQETESTTNPGVFPHMSLGPGQRFASKGCYIVRPNGDQGGLEAASDWLVP